MLPLIPLALSIAAEFAPSLVGWVAGDEAGETARKIVDTAKTVAGVDDPGAALAALKADPVRANQLQLGLAQIEVELYRAETERLRVVNETMRSESSAEDPYVRRWRPTWGYITAGAWGTEALAVVCAIGGATAATLAGKAADAKILLDGLAALINAMALAWTVALAVLGVQIQARSAEKGGAAATAGGLWGMVRNLAVGARK